MHVSQYRILGIFEPMKIQTLLAAIGIILFYSCSSTSEEQNSTVTKKSNLKEDTTEAIQTSEPIDQNLTTEFESDFNLLIDKVHSFSETNDFYISINFNQEYDYDSINVILSKLDSSIYDGGEMNRTRLPHIDALKYFDLTGLDSVGIYNYENQLIGNFQLTRVEYLQDMIESSFVAVYHFDESIDLSANYYTINGTSKVVPNFTTNKITLNRELKFTTNSEVKYHYLTEHVTIPYLSDTITLFTYLSENSKQTSLIIEWINGEQENLLKLQEEYVIWELKPLPIIYNKKSVLLLTVGYPETDIIWYTPAIFNGEQYSVTNNSKVKVEDLAINQTENDQTESDCIFNDDYYNLTKQWLSELEITNYVWDDSTNRAIIINQNDSTFIYQGGCDHYVFAITSKYYQDSTSIEDHKYWLNKALELASKFQFDRYYQMLDQDSLKIGAVENNERWIEIPDDDQDDNLFYTGIQLVESSDFVQVRLSKYIN